MKKKVLISVISVLLIIEGISLFLTYKSYNNIPKNVLENVKTVDLFDKRDKTLSIMLQEEGSDFKEATDRSVWPDINKYVYDKAECTDSDGNSVDYKTVLTFNYDKKTTTIKTKNTIYCTLYFVKGKASLQLLQTQGSSTFTLKNGMYRFIGSGGQVTHNYICFGTTDLSKCTSDPNEFMYRIIGVTNEADTKLGLHANQLKIIKATPSNTSRIWHSWADDTKWDGSAMKTYLNGTGNNQFLGTVKWESPDYWEGLITSQSWYNVDLPATPPAMAEPTDSTTAESKIGLMYATDYSNAYSANSDNWLFIGHGWSSNTAVDEWTISRYSYGGTNVKAWCVRSSGSLKAYSLDESHAVRPAFYLQPGVTLVGEGNAADPFRIAG